MERNELSDESEQSPGYCRNIIPFELQRPKKKQGKDPVNLTPRSKIIDFGQPRPNKTQTTTPHTVKNQVKKQNPSAFQILSEEIAKLARTVNKLNNDLEVKKRENLIKETRLRELEKSFLKSRGKIKKLKYFIVRHDDKIGYIEERLNCLESNSLRRKNYASDVTYPKKSLNIGITSQKTLAAKSSNVKFDYYTVISPKAKKK